VTLFRVKLYCEIEVALGAMNWKPESRPPPLMLVQGAANDDWVTVWFFERLVKQHISIESHITVITQLTTGRLWYHHSEPSLMEDQK
jgi:hypothetical protein